MNKCEYCHPPFEPVMMKKQDGYIEAVLSLHDKQGTYFGFYEERPDGTYSKIGLDTFKFCPMCGRRLESEDGDDQKINHVFQQISKGVQMIDEIKVLLVMFIVTAMVWLAAYTVLTAVNVLKDWRRSK